MQVKLNMKHQLILNKSNYHIYAEFMKMGH